jgi:hypothetical protein
MKTTRRRVTMGGWLLGLALLAACGSTVEPIDLHDSVIPLDARKFVADAQDGLSIARAKREVAIRELDEVETWRDKTLDNLDWLNNAGARTAIEKLADARVELAQMEKERADAELELAVGKLDLVTAQTAIRNDIAIYELDPLRDRVEAALERVKDLGNTIEQHQRKLDQMTGQWWEAYASFVRGGGNSAAYFAGRPL